MEDERTFSQEEVNKLVGEARVKSRVKAETDAASKAEQAAQDAKQETLEAQNEWQTLAETHKARANELEPLVKRIEDYETVIKDMLKSTITGLGEGAKKAVSALPSSMSSLEKLNWVSKNAELFQAQGAMVGTPHKAQTQQQTTKPRRKVRL